MTCGFRVYALSLLEDTTCLVSLTVQMELYSNSVLLSDISDMSGHSCFKANDIGHKKNVLMTNCSIPRMLVQNLLWNGELDALRSKGNAIGIKKEIWTVSYRRWDQIPNELWQAMFNFYGRTHNVDDTQFQAAAAWSHLVSHQSSLCHLCSWPESLTGKTSDRRAAVQPKTLSTFSGFLLGLGLDPWPFFFLFFK